MSSPETAEEHLRVIRSLMERATHYRALSAQGALVGGVLSLFTGGWLYRRALASDQDGAGFALVVWLAVLGITATANVTFLWLDERRRGEPFLSTRSRWAFRALAPSFLLAACATWVLASHGPLRVHYGFALFWSGCYALALLATSHFAPPSIAWLGRSFLVATIIGIFLPDWLGEASSLNGLQLFNLYMAVIFGGFHLVYAACVWPRAARHDPGHV